MSKKIKPTEPLAVGTRVRHAKDKNLDAGVIVWQQPYRGTHNKRIALNAEWSVHWANGDRGIYRSEDVLTIHPKKMKKIIVKDIIKEISGD